jgi:hypothetical protein
VELEVDVKLDESYTGALRDAGPELLEAVADVVLLQADLGLRFYPVLAQNYGRSDPRPDYVMNVDVRDLQIGYGHRTVSEKGQEPKLETFVEDLTCSVSATVTKRRAKGPSLTVGHFEGSGTVPVGAEPAADALSYEVLREDDKPALSVQRSHLLEVAERGLGRALKGLIAPVDRELGLHSQTEQPATPK